MSSTTIVKAPVISQGGNINLASGILTGVVPQGYYDGTETITASDSDLISSNVKNGVNIFGVTGSFAGNNNPLFSNIEFNVSGLVVMADGGSGNYEPGFISGAQVIGGNLYQVLNIMHRDDNSNSSEIGHYTVIVKRTPGGSINRYTQLWSTGAFTTSFIFNSTINVNGSLIQIHTSYGPGYFITFDTSTDTFSFTPGLSGSITCWSDYTNYGVNQFLSPFGAAIFRTTSTGGVLGSAISTTASFAGYTYGCTNLCVHRSYGTGAGQSYNIGFSTRS